jgi:hypothetical protein
MQKNLDVIEITLIGHLNASLKQDMKFYARFLAIDLTKMKSDRVLKDQGFDGDSLKEESEAWSKKAEEKYWKN